MSARIETEATAAAVEALADSRRRHLLSILVERAESLSLDALATEVAASEHGFPIVPDDHVRSVHVELVHNHVPRLLEAGLLTDATVGGTRTVGLADHPLLETEWVALLLETPAGGPATDEETVNRTLEALGPRLRRIVCDELAKRPDGLAVTDLAATVVARTDDVRLGDVAEPDWTPVATALVHDHLPALADAGLVEYDRQNATASIAADAPQWRAEWLAASPLGTVASMVDARRSPDDGSSPGGDSPLPF